MRKHKGLSCGSPRHTQERLLRRELLNRKLWKNSETVREHFAGEPQKGVPAVTRCDANSPSAVPPQSRYLRFYCLEFSIGFCRVCRNLNLDMWNIFEEYIPLLSNGQPWSPECQVRPLSPHFC